MGRSSNEFQVIFILKLCCISTFTPFGGGNLGKYKHLSQFVNIKLA